MQPSYELALFEQAPDGSIRLLGRLTDAALISEARKRILADRRDEIARLERESGCPSVRLVEDPEDG